jgi:hypothetical protein
MPPFGSVDPDLLDFCEQTQRMLISLDRRSMPGHVTAFLAAQRHTWGVGLVTGGATLQRLIEDLRLIWSASDAEEWRDRLFYLPLG